MIDNFEEIKNQALKEAKKHNSDIPIYVCARKCPWSPDKYEIFRVANKVLIRGIYIGYYYKNQLIEDGLSESEKQALEIKNIHDSEEIERNIREEKYMFSLLPKHSLLHRFGEWLTNNIW